MNFIKEETWTNLEPLNYFLQPYKRGQASGLFLFQQHALAGVLIHDIYKNMH